MIPSEQQIDVVFSALANPVRRKLLAVLLSEQNLSASALADRFDLSRPSVSEHLSVLEKAGMVSASKSGRNRFYQLEPEPIMSAVSWLDAYRSFWQSRMGNLRQFLDAGGADD